MEERDFPEKIEYLIGDEKLLGKPVPPETPFSEGRLSFLQEVSRLLQQGGQGRHFPDIASFAFWIRRASMASLNPWTAPSNVFRLGRGTLFHIAPSNVAVNYAYSFAAGFICGNRNIVRLPSRDFPQVAIINAAFREALARYPAYAPYVFFLRYGRARAANDFFSSLCDVRVIWGGDETIRAIRQSPLPPRATEVSFADRYSFMAIDAGWYLQKTEETEAAGWIAQDFYNDTLLTDQNACTSPHLLAWIGNEAAIQKAKERFWNAFAPLAAGRYAFQEIMGVDKLSTLCSAAAHSKEGMLQKIPGEDNLLWRIQVSGDLTEESAEILQENRGNAGFFYEMDSKDALSLRPLCNGKTQTLIYIGEADMFLPLLQSGISGIDRIVPAGHSMDFDFLWDGYDLSERFTRCIPIMKRHAPSPL